MASVLCQRSCVSLLRLHQRTSIEMLREYSMSVSVSKDIYVWITANLQDIAVIRVKSGPGTGIKDIRVDYKLTENMILGLNTPGSSNYPISGRGGIRDKSCTSDTVARSAVRVFSLSTMRTEDLGARVQGSGE